MTLMERAPVEFRSSRKFCGLALGGSLLFVLFGTFLILAPGASLAERIAGGSSFVVFGCSAALYALELMRPVTRFWIDAEGVHSRYPLAAVSFDLPWSRLASAKSLDFGGQPMLVLIPIDADWGTDAGSFVMRKVNAANRALVGSWMVVSPRLYGQKGDAMLDAITRLHPAPSTPKG